MVLELIEIAINIILFFSEVETNYSAQCQYSRGARVNLLRNSYTELVVVFFSLQLL